MSLPVIIVRPEPGASATAARAEAMGLTAITSPIFQIAPLDWTPPEPGDFDAVLVTSANAMRQGGAGLSALHQLPILAVGDATARAASEAGFKTITAGNGDGLALVRLAVDAGYSRLLHLCGHDHRTLVTAGAAITPLHVYAAVPIDPPPSLPQSGVLLLHSPRAAALVAGLVEDRAALHIVAISTAALAKAGDGWASTHAAPHPNDAAMLAIVAEICQQGAE